MKAEIITTILVFIAYRIGYIVGGFDMIRKRLRITKKGSVEIYMTKNKDD